MMLRDSLEIANKFPCIIYSHSGDNIIIGVYIIKLKVNLTN